MPIDDPGVMRRDVEHAALRALARASSVEESAPEILKGISEALGWDFAAIWTLDAEESSLALFAMWYRDAGTQGEFATTCRRTTFERGIGLPGRVWDAGTSMWLANLDRETNFPRSPVAAAVGLRSAVGVPVAADRKLVGVMEFLSSGPEEPDAELLDVLETIGRQIGELLEGERLEQELIFQKALLESQGEAALDGILLVSVEQKVLYWNQRLIEMWGVPSDVLERGDAFEVNVHMAEVAADPTIFDEIAEAIRADPALSRRDQIPLSDGRVFDRWTAPVHGPHGRRLGRAVYYRDITREKRFEERLRASEQWSAFLADAATLLSESLDIEEILERLAQLTVPMLADWCVIHLVDDDGLARPLAVAHQDPDKVGLVREYQTRFAPDPNADTGVAQVIASRAPLIINALAPDALQQQARSPEQLELLRKLAFHSVLVVPIIARDHVLGAVSFVASESKREYSPDDLSKARELASRAGFAIDNARLYEESRSVAQTLQKSFLPPELPDMPGIDVAARYFPAGHGVMIGGDFYDAFRIDARRFGFVLGDVSGKGLEAATVTTLARHTIRGAALTATHPSEALHVLNAALIEQQQTDRFCTAVYAIVDPRFARVRVTVSSGGHPPPYVIRNDGTVEPIECGGTLLGFIEDVSLRDADVELEFGDKLFLYTDGCLDIRRAGGMFGQEGLEKLLYECAKRGTEAAAEHISQTLLDLQEGNATDDIAFILMGVRSSVFNIAKRGSFRSFLPRRPSNGG